MATELRTALIPAILELNSVNDFVLRTVFGQRRYFSTAQVQYDLASTTKKSAGFNSFRDSATIIEKDGFKKVVLTPFSVNEKSVISPEDAEARGFSQPQFGAGDTTSTVDLEDELNGFGKLRARHKRLEVKTAYEAWSTGKIVYGIDGIDEIVFGMPDDNIETVANAWTDTSNSDPVADMIAAYDAMSTKPDRVVLGYDAYQAFVAHPEVHFGDGSDGKGKNVERAMTEEIGREGRDVIYVGRLVERPLEIYCDMGIVEMDDGMTEHLCPGSYALYGAANEGAVLYGGVPIDAATLAATEFVPLKSVQDDPAQVSLIYRSRPLPTLRNPNAFYSQKVI